MHVKADCIDLAQTCFSSQYGCLLSLACSIIAIVFIVVVILEVSIARIVTRLLNSNLLFGSHVEKSPVSGLKVWCTKTLVKQFFVQSPLCKGGCTVNCSWT